MHGTLGRLHLRTPTFQILIVDPCYFFFFSLTPINLLIICFLLIVISRSFARFMHRVGLLIQSSRFLYLILIDDHTWVYSTIDLALRCIKVYIYINRIKARTNIIRTLRKIC